MPESLPPIEYPRKHPELWAPLTDAVFEPAFLRLLEDLEGGASSSRPREVVDSLYSLGGVFSQEWCRQLLEEMAHFKRWCAEPGHPAPQMGLPPVVLADMGLRPVFDAVVARLRPLTAALFPEVGGGSLDSHHAFAAEWRMDGDRDLASHVDSGEVVLNVCLELSEDLCGTAVVFEGRRCPSHMSTGCHDSERISYVHEVGSGLLHAGLHRHAVETLQSGHRLNLVVNMRSSAYSRDYAQRMAQGACPEWCGIARYGFPPSRRKAPRRAEGACERTRDCSGVDKKRREPEGARES